MLVRYLTASPTDYVADIALYLDEAKAKKRRIFMSTLIMAEVKPSQLQQRGFTDFQAFMDAVQADITLIGPTPPILLRAARLRNFDYHQTPKHPTEKNRVMGGMDAVHVATCLYVKEGLGVTDVEFHTFDDGKSKNYLGKTVSLLNYQTYSKHIANNPDVKAVCDLTRCKPKHPKTVIV